VILQRPPDAWCLYVLAHGAGAGMRHPFLQSLADALAAGGVATLRYEFPYMEAGRRRIDPVPALHARVREALAEGARSGLPLLAGGKSFGGRMTSQAQALEPLRGVRGLVFVGFPLHPAGKPATNRAEHLRDVRIPMLFLQGTRDALAELHLLRPIAAELTMATLREVEGADHGFRLPRRRDVFEELAGAFIAWARPLLGEEAEGIRG
jgi:predicted alpha/beta-hydrolase family hydrolase